MYDIQNARQRDGDKAEDRSDRVERILTRPRLGHGESDPLVSSVEGYDDYPEQPDDLTTPEARQFVTELFAHDKVNSIRDAVEETTPATGDSQIVQKWCEAFERATELFDVETPANTEGDDDSDEHTADSRLAELAGDYPEDMRNPSNPLVVSNLYAGRGLSVEEIADVFSDDSDTRVKSERVRGVLRSAGLIRATESEDSDPSHRLGGASFEVSDDPSPSGNTGVNIDSEAIARDPHISVERDE